MEATPVAWAAAWEVETNREVAWEAIAAAINPEVGTAEIAVETNREVAWEAAWEVTAVEINPEAAWEVAWAVETNPVVSGIPKDLRYHLIRFISNISLGGMGGGSGGGSSGGGFGGGSSGGNQQGGSGGGLEQEGIQAAEGFAKSKGL